MRRPQPLSITSWNTPSCIPVAAARHHGARLPDFDTRSGPSIAARPGRDAGARARNMSMTIA